MSPILINNLRLDDCLFELEADQFSAETRSASQRELASILESLRQKQINSVSPREQIAMIGQTLFRARGYQFSTESRSEAITLTATLGKRNGNCLGLTTVYTILAEQLSLPIRPLLYDGHIALGCFHYDPPLHVETSRRGAVLNQSHVGRLYAAPEGKGRLLTAEEFLAVHLSNRAAFFLAAEERNSEALESLDQAISFFPHYSAAWINRAVLLVKFNQIDQAVESLENALLLPLSKKYRSLVQSFMAQIHEQEFEGLEDCPT